MKFHLAQLRLGIIHIPIPTITDLNQVYELAQDTYPIVPAHKANPVVICIKRLGPDSWQITHNALYERTDWGHRITETLPEHWVWAAMDGTRLDAVSGAPKAPHPNALATRYLVGNARPDGYLHFDNIPTFVGLTMADIWDHADPVNPSYGDLSPHEVLVFITKVSPTDFTVGTMTRSGAITLVAEQVWAAEDGTLHEVKGLELPLSSSSSPSLSPSSLSPFEQEILDRLDRLENTTISTPGKG